MQVKSFPKDMSALDIDPREPRRCLVSGLFEEEVAVGDEKRKFLTYIRPGQLYSQPCVVIAPPDGTPTLDWLKKSHWIDFAEKAGVFLHVMIPAEGGWNTDGSDAEYMNKIYLQIQSRKYYITIQDNIYAVGIGKGAIIAQQAAMKMTSEWSGLATFGEMDSSALLNAETAGGTHATGATELAVSGDKAQLPVWMAWGENAGANADVCAYWKAQNDADPEPYASKWADEIYFPSTVCKKSQINEEKISQVRVTNGFAGEPDASLWDAVWAYIRKACRHRSFGTKALRNFADPIAYGAELHRMDYAGFTRTWYEYVPASVQNSAGPVPLVICMHGRGGSAESFMDMSGINRVAEERGFIAMIPEAGVYQQNAGGLRNVLLWNGEYKGERIDDTGFILAAIRDIKARRNIDATRVYACGQSSGGMMSSDLAIAAPDVFAAVAPWSAIVNPSFSSPLPESISPIVPYMFLFGNRDWLCVDKENGELEYHIARNVAAFLKNLMKLYGLNETPMRYTCGEISYFVYQNAKGVPLLVVGSVKGMTHANYPRESWISYDEFLCKFSKREDGTLLYMGKDVIGD